MQQKEKQRNIINMRLIVSLFMLLVFVTAIWNNFVQLQISISLTKWVSIIIGIATVLGVINLTLIHGQRISNRSQEMLFSLLLIGSMYVTIISGFFFTGMYNWIFGYVYMEVYTYMFALLAPFFVFAAYRDMRVKNLKLWVFSVPAILAIIGNTPLVTSVFPQYKVFNDWLWAVPIAGAARGWTIPTAVTMLAFAILTITGYTNRQKELQ